ncbi:MAG TPA: 1-deoxy-D-xylulose-5-phosphate synthase [Bacillota bacterium]|nr:1-deoxy-D-xylulose-5-phosphate synthase [Bacillota bacterium]HPZ21405.1 1-deoxy-D-xylulose-5-phosphate synthase [Bacillota bacterium]HQD19266.1 1-deoxy-D-xylulose-5-phosphate synthase [Bacillota bacterium]
MDNKLLNRINCPQDLKKLSAEELELLAAELRQEVLTVVSENGGHLASNLGVVELTLALHSVYDSPADKIIWDVGHQCYIHKLLTGRRREFSTLRRFGGLSGFPKTAESPHDIAETGHSSTSISVAMGMAIARDLNRDNYSVVAVIGDGSLGGGMALEALNCVGSQKLDLTIILNDNEMSISRNVGGLSSYLSRVRTDPKYTRLSEDLKFLLQKIPAVGDSVYRAAERVKSSIKYLLVRGMLFEELGFTYLGPIDGHNIEALQKILRRAKSYKGPVLIHVVTKKGKGYGPAEAEPAKFHGLGAFDAKTGAVPVASRTYTDVFSDTICALAEKDPRIVAITAAMPEGTGLSKFASKYPGRFFDVGIAEQHAVTMAAGMARAGYRPVVAIYSTFLQRAYDQIVHDVCLANLPVVFAIDRAGIVGADGETHQGIFDIAMLRHIPNMTIMMPKDFTELRAMLDLCLKHKGPVALRYPRGSASSLPVALSGAPLAVGKGEVLRDGKDLAILGMGPTLVSALQAQAQLHSQGISAAVINLRFAKPLDQELIEKYARRCGRLITIEEHVLDGGLGSAVLEACSARGITPATKLLGIKDWFVPHGEPQQLRELCNLAAADIVAAAQEFMARGKIHDRENKA